MMSRAWRETEMKNRDAGGRMPHPRTASEARQQKNRTVVSRLIEHDSRRNTVAYRDSEGDICYTLHISQPLELFLLIGNRYCS
jgi:hypothetical protein